MIPNVGRRFNFGNVRGQPTGGQRSPVSGLNQLGNLLKLHS